MGCAKDVSYRNITVNNVQQPILVDQYYNSKGGSGGVSGSDLKLSLVTDIPRINRRPKQLDIVEYSLPE